MAHYKRGAGQRLSFYFFQSEKCYFSYPHFLLLRRLLHGEERNEELFRAVSEMMHFLEDEELSGKELLALEIAMNLKILHHLGYGTDREMYRVFIMMPPSKSVLNEIDAVKSQALADINAALKESHL